MPSLSGNNPFGATPNATTTQQSAPSYTTVTNAGDGNTATFKGIELWWRTYDVPHSIRFVGHKYPGVAGQAIEVMGRDSYPIHMETVWFGDNWRQRLDNFLAVMEADPESGSPLPTSGLLVLPDGRAINCLCAAGTEQYDHLQGCTMPLTFEEDSFEPYYQGTSTDPTTAMSSDLSDWPSEALVVEPFVDEYAALLASPSRIAEREMLEAYRLLDAALYAAQQGCDLTTQDGVGFENALTLCRWHAQQAFPFPDLLG